MDRNLARIPVSFQVMRGRNLIAAAVLPCIVIAAPGASTADLIGCTRGQPVVETGHAVEVRLVDGVAVFDVERTFRNEGKRAEEMELLIDLPEEMVARGFKVKGSKKWHVAKLLPGMEALDRYLDLTEFLAGGTSKLRTVALLSWSWTHRLKLALFPIRPGEKKTVRYRLVQPPRYTSGMHVVRYPADPGAQPLVRPTLRVAGQPFEVPEPGELEDGLAPIPIRGPGIDTVDARYGVFDLGSGTSLARVEVNAAAMLRPKPEEARVVFVVDGSRSWEREGIDAALELTRAYVAHLPDALFELVIFDRSARRAFDTFVPAGEWNMSLWWLATHTDRLEPRNGSDIASGLALASSLLEDVEGPGRIVLVTDARMRTRHANEPSLETLERLPEGVVAHVVHLFPYGSEVEARRQDSHPLAPIPLSRGGILLRIDGGRMSEDFEQASLELVRPVRIDDLEILIGDDERVWKDAPEVLDEGEGYEDTILLAAPPDTVTVRGRIWASELSMTVNVDADFGADLLPALAFSSDLHEGLDHDEMMAAALAGRAVSPGTSYLVVEPGAAPHERGIERTFGNFSCGGLGVYGTGSSCCGIGTVGKGPGNDESDLGDLVRQAAAYCFTSGLQDAPLEVRLELTFREIVDVEALGATYPEFATCVQDRVWEIDLPHTFHEERYETLVALPVPDVLHGL